LIEVGRTGGDGIADAWSACISRWEGSRSGEGGVCGKESWITDFAKYPFLNQLDILASGDLDGSLVIVKPSISVSCQTVSTATLKQLPLLSYPEADMVGQTSGLQIGSPVFSSMVRMICIMLSRILYCSTTREISKVKLKAL
jgi:hypothetical protein